MTSCRVCKKDFYCYLNRKVYCSDKCYKEQKHLNNITRWKTDIANRKVATKKCRRCTKDFTLETSGSYYCSTCKELLAEKPKKKKLVVKKKVTKKKKVIIMKVKKCKTCNIELPNAHNLTLYCKPCKVLSIKENRKRLRNESIEKTKVLKAKNKAKPKRMVIDPKWLTRGNPLNLSTGCMISQEA